MYRHFHVTGLTVLTAVFLLGSSATVLAVQQDDSNVGPGFANSAAPPAGQEQEQAQGPGFRPSDQPAGGGSGQTGGPGQAGGGPAQQAQTGEGNKILPADQAYLQIQLLRSDAATWTDAVTNDTAILPGDQGFLSMCIYANKQTGDVLYRTYTSAAGWSNWAMNGAHTDWNAGAPVEAVQIRLNGVYANMASVYYSSTLSDGTVCDWACNGGTSGTMAIGKYITGLRVALCDRNGGGASYPTARPVHAAAEEGFHFADGALPTYTSGTGQPFTGWAWNDRDRYYFVDNNAVTGWQYIDGYKYFFESDGRLVTDLEPYLNSGGPFYLRINKQMNCTTVYIQDGDNGYIIPYKTFLCSTGDDTPVGNHVTPEKYRWRLMNTGEYCQYCTRLGAGLPILMHSVIYSGSNPYTLKPSTYNYLGLNRSHGCIRFVTRDAKWIYEHCPLGTSVNVYNSPIPGPYDRPAIQQMIPDTQTWDPTDPAVPENNIQE